MLALRTTHGTRPTPAITDCRPACTAPLVSPAPPPGLPHPRQQVLRLHQSHGVGLAVARVAGRRLPGHLVGQARLQHGDEVQLAGWGPGVRAGEQALAMCRVSELVLRCGPWSQQSTSGANPRWPPVSPTPPSPTHLILLGAQRLGGPLERIQAAGGNHALTCRGGSGAHATGAGAGTHATLSCQSGPTSLPTRARLTGEESTASTTLRGAMAAAELLHAACRGQGL